MTESKPISGFIKRLNLIVVILTFLGSLLVAYMAGNELHREEVYRINNDDWIDVPLDSKKQGGPWEKYAAGKKIEKPPFDPDKYLADQKAKEERVSNVSKIKYGLMGLGIGFLFFGSVLFLMATISWLFGHKFKLHISTQ